MLGSAPHYARVSLIQVFWHPLSLGIYYKNNSRAEEELNLYPKIVSAWWYLVVSCYFRVWWAFKEVTFGSQVSAFFLLFPPPSSFPKNLHTLSVKNTHNLEIILNCFMSRVVSLTVLNFFFFLLLLFFWFWCFFGCGIFFCVCFCWVWGFFGWKGWLMQCICILQHKWFSYFMKRLETCEMTGSYTGLWRVGSVMFPHWEEKFSQIFFSSQRWDSFRTHILSLQSTFCTRGVWVLVHTKPGGKQLLWYKQSFQFFCILA